MQFRVPQNIDLEDKIVGPLTLIQFVYCIVGGLIVYILFQSLAGHTGVFLLLGIPVAAVTLAMAFLKIQDQPLSHFITAGIAYLTKPKIRYWRRLGYDPKIVNETVIVKQNTAPQPVRKNIEKSDLEQLAYTLDTKPINEHEEKYFGKITSGFEKVLQQHPQNNPQQIPQNQAPQTVNRSPITDNR